MLALHWKQILNVDEFTIVEKKTGKQRTIRINQQLKRHIADCYKQIQPIGINAPILVSQKGTVYRVQSIDVLLKKCKSNTSYRLKTFHAIH